MTPQEARAKAKEFTSHTPNGNRTEEEQKQFESEYARRLQFEATFNEWLRLRATDLDSEEAEEARYDRENECADLVLTTPAVYDWMIFQKFEVIEHYLAKHGEVCSGMELMAAQALASIKIDLLRFGLQSEQKEQQQ